MSICPFANQSYRYDQRYPTSRFTGGPDKGVLHTTEGGSLPGYSGGQSAPHFTVRANVRTKTVTVYQHFDTNRPARALLNKDGGVQTNNDSAIQVELIGSCHRATAEKYGLIYWPEAPQWALDGLKKLMRWIEKDRGIPRRSTPRPWLAYGKDSRRPGISPASYGNSPARMTQHEWDTFAGWCGHQHVAENDHGDPGNIDIGYLLELTGRKVVTKVGVTLAALAAAFGLSTAQVQSANPGIGPTVRPSTTVTLPSGVNPSQAPEIAKPVPEPAAPKPPKATAPSSSSSTRTLSKGTRGSDVAAMQRKLGIPADGSFGPKTDRALRDFQYAKGLTVDGRYGPASRKAMAGGWGKQYLRYGDRGRYVVIVQRRVGAAQDGKYGPKTTAKVKSYQRANRLTVDGKFGPQSWGYAYR